MTIKCFKAGQTAYAMGDGYSSMRDKYSVSEVRVEKVGRKYVTIAGNWGEQFKETSASRSYLIEHRECGAPRLLFPSRKAAEEYREREELKAWVREAAGWSKIDRYTLAQLRQVKQILERVRSENGPLTLFELECMIGERVWVEGPGARENGCYAVVEGVDHEGQVLITKGGFPYYNYGELGAWQAYHEKPEEDIE